jgi:hypothetical protein
MDWLLPMLIIRRTPKSRRAVIAEQLLPILLPGPAAQRLAIAAITAERQGRRQALADKAVVSEAVEALEIDARTDLEKKFPSLHQAFKRLTPEVQELILPKTSVQAKVPTIEQIVRQAVRELGISTRNELEKSLPEFFEGFKRLPLEVQNSILRQPSDEREAPRVERIIRDAVRELGIGTRNELERKLPWLYESFKSLPAKVQDSILPKLP